jgi:hypothetical protein
MKIGDTFQVKSDHGKYRCIGWNKDGSIKAYGGTRGREKMRDIRKEEVRVKIKSLRTSDDQALLF